MGDTLIKYRLGDIVTEGNHEFLITSIDISDICGTKYVFYDARGIEGGLDRLKILLVNNSPWWKIYNIFERKSGMMNCKDCSKWGICHGMMENKKDCWFPSEEFIVNDTVQKMIAKLGEDFEIDVAIEEMSELIKELLKYKRGKVLEREKQAARRDHVVEEIGDVMFMMEYLKKIFDITDEEIQKIVVEKAKRTKRRYIDGEK